MTKAEEPKEPKVVVKPIGGLGGLDQIHVALIILVCVLVALVVVLAYYRPTAITVVNNTTAAKPMHTSSEMLNLTERLLASYNNLNSSLNLLPYITNISAANITYISSIKSWLIRVPAANPATNVSFYVTFLINDSNTSKVLPLIQTVLPAKLSQNKVVAKGVVQLYNHYPCNKQPMPVYWFIDPYAPGGIKSLNYAVQLQNMLKGKVNVTIKIFSTQATQAIASQYGIANAQLLGKYIFCASLQPNFEKFANILSSLFAGSFMGQIELSNIANESGLNYSELSSCIGTSQPIINNQALLASYYNITQVPSVIVDCNLMTLPQTAYDAVCFANSTLCR